MSDQPRSRPEPAEYREYSARYVSLVQEADVLSLMDAQAGLVHDALAGLSDERSGHRYAPGKWSVREALGHMIDTERVFGFRALAVARGETWALPGFDENAYAAIAGADRVPIGELAEEFATVRRSHVLMFRHLDEAAWRRIGTVYEHPTSVRALAFIMAGHVRHHATLFAERYGIPVRA